MATASLSTLLVDFGLTEHESAVYLASLSLGPTSVLKIAQTAGVKRTTVYSIVGSLLKKGLMRKEVHGFKNALAAEPPEKLEAVLDQRKELLAKAMPELAALYNLKGGESTIKYYEGLTGVKSVYENLLSDVRPKEDYLVISEMEHWVNLDEPFFMDFLKRRAKLPITIRMLLQDTTVSREHKKLEKNFNESVKILPKGTSLNTNLVVIPQKVVIHQLVPPIMAIVIENPSVVKMHQELFEIIWRSLPDK